MLTIPVKMNKHLRIFKVFQFFLSSVSCSYLDLRQDNMWRRLHNEELYDIYFLSNVIWVIKSRRMRWAAQVACRGDRRGAYRVLVGIPKGKRPLERPRHR
jgi:hypothetical protein